MKRSTLQNFACSFVLSFSLTSCLDPNGILDLMDPSLKYVHPIDVTIKEQDQRYSFTWSPIPEAVEYWVDCSYFPDDPYGNTFTTVGYTESPLYEETREMKPGQEYRYIVTAYKYNRKSERVAIGKSETISITIPVPENGNPEQPKNVGVLEEGGSIVLSWGPVGEELTYDVYYAYGPTISPVPETDEYVLCNQAPLKSLTCPIDPATLGIPYNPGAPTYLYFHVVATDNGQRSSFPSLPVRIPYTVK